MHERGSVTHHVEAAILDTVRYFDLFQMPLTATQIWRCLIVEYTPLISKTVSLSHIRELLTSSPRLAKSLSMKWGYYCLAGHEEYIEARLQRHCLAQDKWKLTNRVAKYLALVPFVRAMAGSGSLALDNTKASSDLDIFFIVKSGRIWTARLLLLIVAHFSGRRRTYWDVEAPDKVCLNHYITDNALRVSLQVSNLYTAVQYTLHVPLLGAPALRAFREKNADWIGRYVRTQELPPISHLYEVRSSSLLFLFKTFMEGWLLEPIGNAVERLAEYIERLVVQQHESPRLSGAGRVVMNDEELAFHPDTKVPAILESFALSHKEKSALGGY